MLENRSFDNLLGWLYEPDERPDFDGVAGKDLSNPIPEGAKRHDKNQKTIPVGKGEIMTNPNPDPGEEFSHVNVQLFNKTIPEDDPAASYKQNPYNAPDPLPTPAGMQGFVHDYVNHLTELEGKAPSFEQYRIIMDCFPPEAVPVMSSLAKNYAVCDRWFSSVPSQTWCNRAFIASGTSTGHVVNPPYVNWMFDAAPTIFNRIEEDPHKASSWKIYFDEMDIFSLTKLMQPALHDMPAERFGHMDDFFNDIDNDSLPSYSFIEPRFQIDHNDMHPPLKVLLSTSSVLGGEVLINEIYQKIRGNQKVWEKTLLIITFDEHGGCYDHVSPPTFAETPLAVPPDKDMPVGQHGFRFDRLGIRVPSIVISAYTEAGTVDQLDTPRTDKPEVKPRPFKRVNTDEARSAEMNALQRAILVLAAGFAMKDKIDHDKSPAEKVEDTLRLIAEEGKIAELKTVGEGIDYLIAIEKGDAPGCLAGLKRMFKK
jgi:phospholipase C